MPNFIFSQWEPIKVQESIFKKANYHTPIDTVVFENYRYIYNVRGDSTFISWQLSKKEKLYSDSWKVVGVSYFLTNMSAFVFLPQTNIQPDKYLHGAVGYVIGASTTALMYKWTKRKWLSFGVGLLASGLVGVAKEAYDSRFGGVSSWQDGMATVSGGIDGCGGTVIVIGHREKVKHFIQP